MLSPNSSSGAARAIDATGRRLSFVPGSADGETSSTRVQVRHSTPAPTGFRHPFESARCSIGKTLDRRLAHSRRQNRKFQPRRDARRTPDDCRSELSLSPLPISPVRWAAAADLPRVGRFEFSLARHTHLPPRRAGSREAAIDLVARRRAPDIFVTTIYLARVHRVCGTWAVVFVLLMARRVTPRIFGPQRAAPKRWFQVRGWGSWGRREDVAGSG
jgi:hypothetical protein